jgi:hypothetical protein
MVQQRGCRCFTAGRFPPFGSVKVAVTINPPESQDGKAVIKLALIPPLLVFPLSRWLLKGA